MTSQLHNGLRVSRPFPTLLDFKPYDASRSKTLADVTKEFFKRTTPCRRPRTVRTRSMCSVTQQVMYETTNGVRACSLHILHAHRRRSARWLTANLHSTCPTRNGSTHDWLTFDCDPVVAYGMHTYRSTKGCYDVTDARHVLIAFNPTKGRYEADRMADEPEHSKANFRDTAYPFFRAN